MEEDFNEIISAADLVGLRPNYVTVDEHGFFHAQASGKIDEVIAATEANLARLKRIKQQGMAHD